ncbi:MAG TPA: M20/M25/M40 family metallo-hydrolase [Candidatus Manganitrophaceae bacterium]|nr:M20/M25/M40 family metallo-hydrolase [Candidatus Manganitrophaceae bacterium]
MINTQRMTEHFLKLVQIDSHSKKERAVALQLQKELEELGAAVEFDQAGEAVGGDTGNLIARLPATDPSIPPLLLSAHMDTVVPGEGIKPVVEGKKIRSDGRTILGGDDKSGIAIIVETLRTLREERAPHGEIEVVFTICEEFGLIGAKHLDTTRLKSKYGLVLDCDNVGFLFTRSPSSDRLEFKIHGLEAHAGVCPERGISAIQIAAEAIGRMKLGRIDDETTANIGTIQGGSATNIVPNYVYVKAESRSHSEEKLAAQTAHMRECFRQAAEKFSVEIDGKKIAGRIEEKIWRDYDRMDVPEKSPIVERVMKAAKGLSYTVRTKATGGGCDANVFNRKGITVANLGTGMHDIHTVKEWLSVDEMTRAAEIVLGVLKENRTMK